MSRNFKLAGRINANECFRSLEYLPPLDLPTRGRHPDQNVSIFSAKMKSNWIGSSLPNLVCRNGL
jgi:hypothetical protein